MRRVATILATTALLALLAATPARAAFGLSEISIDITQDPDGTPARLAGSHPYEVRTAFRVNTREHETKGQVVDGAIRNLDVTLPAGFVGDPQAVPPCETIDFIGSGNVSRAACADSSAVGILTVKIGGGTGIEGEETVPVYSLVPSPGVAAKLGFWVADLPITVDFIPTSTPPYNIVASLRNTSQSAEVLSSDLRVWGNPVDSSHDDERGVCVYDGGSCPANIPAKPFITLPRSCDGPLLTTFHATSWWSGDPKNPGPPATFTKAVGSPSMIDCSGLEFSPDFAVRPTTDRAESPTGLEADLEVTDEGLTDPDGRAASDIAAIRLTLPEGITVNPSAAEGLGTCSPAQLALETLSSEPGDGCPQASKIGTLQATTPILSGTLLKGALFIAPQDDPTTRDLGAENPFDTLLALHMVVKEPILGVLIKVSGKIDPDLSTGQLVSTFTDLPPFPLGEVSVRLREGGRSPLISPPSCNTYTSIATLTPTADPQSFLEVPSSFQISRGVDGGPCPPALLPFDPGLQAGTLSNGAGRYSPFHFRLTRRDGDQDLTRFDLTLPPGVIAKLAGVSQCPDQAIAAAKAKRGREELASPSCPANSKIGTVLGGAGVGSQLTYASGSIHLAGPFAGAPISVVGIVPAVAGPFDVGTVVVRQALVVDPRSAEVKVDSTRSDPIPHILAGIPLKVRDVRVDTDRPQFTLNPTGCDPSATLASIWGGGNDPFSTLDDSPLPRSARFQAASCASLGFKPRLQIALKGSTKRGGHPAARGVYRPRPGDANVRSTVVKLPRSVFLEQAHIRTICTRVQFAQKACPKGSVYGNVIAHTPILDQPLKGPIILRSSSNELPDVVFDLHGLVDIEASARVDSIRGGIRLTFGRIPDAPLSKVVISFQGADKGLAVNSTDLCATTSRARATLRAHSGKRRVMRPVVRAVGCGKSAKK